MNNLPAINNGMSDGGWSPRELQLQVNAIQEAMNQVMKSGVHFGTIPGCGDKPSLFKPGAEKLCLMFRLLPTLEINREDLPNGHREYIITCTLKNPSGAVMGQGVGSCTTMETKFRFRGDKAESTGKPLPPGFWDTRKEDPAAAQEMIGGKGFMAKKDDNGMWFIFRASGEKQEHPNIADNYNTVLKMAKKRAFVDATITATAAGDIFTQDIEDMPDLATHAPQPRVEVKQPAPIPAQPSVIVEPEQPKADPLEREMHTYDLTGYPIEKLTKAVKFLQSLNAVQVNETTWATKQRVKNLEGYEVQA